jgi:hypothetical protein
MGKLVRLIRMIWTLAILAALVAPVVWGVYMDRTGRVMTGTVVAKREAILMLGGDAFRHTFELTSEYRSRDGYCAGAQEVDSAFYRSHPVGSAVRLRCPSVFGMAAHLQDASTPWFDSGELTDLAVLGIAGIAVVLAWMAYRNKSKALAGGAAVLFGICFPTGLLATCGVVVLPVLFWGARLNPGKGYGLLLLATMGLCAVVVYERVPQAAPIPDDQVRSAIGTVRQVHLVDEIWSSTVDSESRSNPHAVGQKIGPRYRMVELEFTPVGATEAMHGLDRIDLNTVPGLREGSVVPIEFAASDPESVRIVGATRNYARQIMIHLLSLTYGTGALIAFLVIPLLRAVNKRWRRAVSDVEAVFTPAAESSRWPQLPDDDPRHRVMERAVAALRHARSTEDKHGAIGESRQFQGSGEGKPPSRFVMIVVILITTIFHPGVRQPRDGR